MSPKTPTALVTGGSSGIGLSVATAFARTGATVLIAARDDSKGFAACDKLARDGFKAEFVRTDISSEREVSALHCYINDTYGALDYVFNNAGIGGGAIIWEQEEEEFDRIIAINTKGLWLCLKHQLRLMLRNDIKGAIVNNLSTHANNIVFKGVSAYSASKHAGLALTKAAAFESADAGIRVNAIAPGPIDTRMLRASAEQIGGLRSWTERIPVGRVGTTGEVSDAVLWLCSEQAAFITGAVVNLDGGFSAV